jgi:hypothetical protein
MLYSVIQTTSQTKIKVMSVFVKIHPTFLCFRNFIKTIKETEYITTDAETADTEFPKTLDRYPASIPITE